MNEAIFDKVSDALVFAFRFSVQQYAKAQKIDPTPLGSGRGLTGLDGAAQAAFILTEVEALGKVAKSALKARFAEKITQCECCDADAPHPEWKGACLLLATDVVMPVAGTAHERLAHQLVMRHFSSKIHKRTLADIASKYGDGEDKVKKLNIKVGEALREAESKAQAAISERLVEMGILQSSYKQAA